MLTDFIEYMQSRPKQFLPMQLNLEPPNLAILEPLMNIYFISGY